MLEVFARRHYPCPMGRRGLLTTALARRSAEVRKACQMCAARTKDRELPFFFLYLPGKADATKLWEQCSFGDVFLAYKGQRSRYKGICQGIISPPL